MRTRTALPLVVALGAALLGPTPAYAAVAPGAPGTGSAWTTGAKDGLGTSATTGSKVWFTLGQGVTHEIYYPQVDTANVQDLQFVVSDGATFTELERDATNHTTTLTDQRSLSYDQVNTAKSGKYKIIKSYATDPARQTMLLRTRFQVTSGGPLQLYVLYNPSLNNSGMGDTGATSAGQLVASDGPVSSALAVSTGFTALTSGYSGTSSDGYVDLRANHVLDATYDSAPTPGNLVQFGQVPVGTDTTFTLALAFGPDRSAASAAASGSLATGFPAVATSYADGWHSYLSGLHPAPASVTSTGLVTQYNVALMTLKAHEDKTYLGANVASLTVPWGQAINADNPGTAGYHAVWARDLYQVATAQLAAGDTAAANRSLDYLLNVQQRADGSFPQNTRLDGTPVWGSLQLDEVAYPIILAWHLGRTDAWPRLRKSADFLRARGTNSPQERWEEEAGYSPSTIAAEIAGLVCASALGGDGSYATTADAWRNALDSQTFTTTGHLGDGRYYERVDGDGNPNDGQPLEINSGGGTWDERDVIDGGFLDLVRLGVKRADDPTILASLPELDATLKVTTPNGAMWYRYNHDAYGEKSDGSPYTGSGGIGRLWPLLSGERGEYELLAGRSAATHLATMAASANSGYLIPEQAWDRAPFPVGEGTDSAAPLAWSMAQFVRLALSIDAGSPVERPSVVAARYASTSLTVTVTVPAGTTGPVYLAGNLSVLGTGLPDWDAAGMALTAVDTTHWKVTLPANGAALSYKFTLGDWGHVEKGSSCAEVGNRSSTLTGAPVSAIVANWRNVSPCGN
ncbi:glycoside hydrolase family 15 protein [Longispora fulva]|uniref:Glucoamylase n=1 Tax=Longispora fulva TaxID=619741 RepID=A0A8J7GH57_9ACTN|nr:glycoside hydrolase family 15 protein [Longispora fulva]MBG6137455.1 glucoamylase [Longispora fulva]